MALIQDESDHRLATQAAPHVSPLELLLPRGMAQNARVIGTACPPVLRPAARLLQPGQAELIVLAPTVAECRSAGWLNQATREIGQSLAPDGIVYLLVPRAWRWRIIRRLAERGFSHVTPVTHVPASEAIRFLVPLTSACVSYAMHNLIPSRRARRVFMSVALHTPGCVALFSSVLPLIGMVVRRPDARRELGWMHAERTAPASNAIIRMSSLAKGRTANVYPFTIGATQPLSMVKLALTPGESVKLVSEGRLMQQLGVDARAAGAAVPSVEQSQLADGYAMLTQTLVIGQVQALQLQAQPERLVACVEQVSAWLERWNQRTRQIRTVDGGWVAHELLAPLAQVEQFLPAHYTAWLATRFTQLVEKPLLQVAAHNDLTMWNVLIDQRGQISIVDWEASQVSALPLMDFFYAAVDAVAATTQYRDHGEAARACFSPGGTYTVWLGHLLQRIQQQLAIPHELVQVYLHACWIRHAANELAVPGGAPGPFVRIAQYFASQIVEFRDVTTE